MSARPRLSVIVVLYDMEREARRTLLSLAPPYQRGIAAEDYEVVVVDNGSSRPFQDPTIGFNVSYHHIEKTGISPAPAVNHGVRVALGEWLAIMVDGARLVTPGLLHYGLEVAGLHPEACGLTLGFHLGPDYQPHSLQKGYNRDQEDALLAEAGWLEDGYRLFEIASLHHAADGWFSRVGESNCTFLSRRLYDEIGGMDERFISPAGGLANYDLQLRLWQRAARIVWIVGEGTFHQSHGGVTSGATPDRVCALMAEYEREYLAIRGRPWPKVMPERAVEYIGTVPTAALPFIAHSAIARDEGMVAAQATIQRLHGEVKTRDDTMVLLHQEVAKRDRTIEWLHQEVATRDRTVEWLHREVAQRDARIAEMSRPATRTWSWKRRK